MLSLADVVARRSKGPPAFTTPLRTASPARVLDGQRLTGQRALVEDRDLVLDQTVDGDDLARLHQQQVAGPNVVEWR